MFKIAADLMKALESIGKGLGAPKLPNLRTAPNNFMGSFPGKIDATTPFANVDKGLFARAQARMEGYFAKGSAPNLGQRNFNPGNIRFGNFAASHGGVMGEKGFARFPNEAAGFNAMQALYKTPGYRNQTVGGVINRWAPPTENNTNAYINSVTNWYNGGMR